MAMTMGGQDRGPSANINVTPLIDVLLVLLIIFMVITPMTPRGLDALIPKPPNDNTPPERTIVVQMIHSFSTGTTLRINRDSVTWNDLENRLTEIFKTRAERVIFVTGDDDVPFADVARVIDIAHASNIQKVGLIPHS